MADVKKTPTILDLFESAKKASKLSFSEIGKAAGLPDDIDADDAISNTLRRKRMIHIPLVNWILSQTVYSGEASDRAIAELQGELSKVQLEAIRQHINSYLPADHDAAPGRTVTDAKESPPASYGRRVEDIIRPIEAKPLRINTRDSFPWFEVVKRKPRPKARPMPHYLGLAAGAARVLQACEDLNFVREWTSELHSGTVIGDSMMDTIRPGDRIALAAFNDGRGERLERLPDDRQNPLHIIQQKVRDNEICVISHADAEEEVTLKRIRYQKNADGTWYMQIVADNPDAPVFGHKGSYIVSRKDEIIFWARMIGFIGVRN